MSSLSRRACYKCGDLGHHAEACSSPHRLCYNCKQPSESYVATPRPKHPRLITLRSRPRIERVPSPAHDRGEAVLPLPGTRPRPSRLPHAPHQRCRCDGPLPQLPAVWPLHCTFPTHPVLVSAQVLTWTSVPALPRSTRVRFGAPRRFPGAGSSLVSAAAATPSASALRRATSAEARTTLPVTARRRP